MLFFFQGLLDEETRMRDLEVLESYRNHPQIDDDIREVSQLLKSPFLHKKTLVNDQMFMVFFSLF